MNRILSLLILYINTMCFGQSGIPFTGKRYFNIEQGTSSFGTPSYYLEVKKNSDVYFGFVQINQANGDETKEEINAGKYNPKVMKIYFKTLNEIFYVMFDKEKIYLTDKNGVMKKSEDCCPVSEMGNGNCNCESELYQ